ncbi:MAG: ParB N-terminal domain-containing protein [Verrucomicrobiota bacterium]
MHTTHTNHPEPHKHHSIKVELRDPADLRPLPFVKAMRRWDTESSEWHDFVDDIRAKGIHDPIVITQDGRVVDGETRRQAAKALQLAEVPCRVVPEDEATTAIMRGMKRRNLTKGQTAFLVAELCEDVFAGAEANQTRFLRKGQCFPVVQSLHNGDEKGCSVEKLAWKIGVSTRTLWYAHGIHTLFRAHPEKRTITDRDDVTEEGVTIADFFTRRIMQEQSAEAAQSKPYDLGYVITAIRQIEAQEARAAKGFPHLGGRPSEVQRQLGLFNEGLKTLRTRLTYWEDWDADTRRDALKTIPATFEAMPDELLRASAAAAREEIRRRLNHEEAGK